MADAATGVPTIPWEEITLGPIIGEGGFGIVHRGNWKHGGDVAIKAIKGTLGRDAEKELKDEAGIMARSPSPYIIRLFGLCWEHSRYALVMELMPNASLYDLLHNGRELPWSVRYSIAKDVAYGLRLLHDRHILHRDLKSLNVLLDGNLRAKLTDFGLSKVKSQSKTTTKMGGSSVGTIAWMAPELFSLSPKYTVASDVYAYGMVSWELASREIPYQGADVGVIKDSIKSGERADIPEDCPTSFAALIQSCWAQGAKSRPNMDTVVSSLERIFSSEGSAPAATSGAAIARPPTPPTAHYQGMDSRLGMVTGASPEEKENLAAKAARGRGFLPQFSHTSTSSSATSAAAPVTMVRAVNPAELITFLENVVKGQQDEAEAMLKRNQTLALAAGDVTDHANRTFRGITGFQYAVWALDWHMWRMIKKYLSMEEARAQSEGFGSGSWVREHGEHVTWTKLTDNYKTLIDNWGSWSYEQIETYWVQQIGGAQLILPMHVLQEFCQPGRPFDPIPNFKEDLVLVRRLPDWLVLSKVGRDWSVRRGGQAGMQCRLSLGDNMLWMIKFDCLDDREALIRLSDTRHQQREELIAELRKSPRFGHR